LPGILAVITESIGIWLPVALGIIIGLLHIRSFIHKQETPIAVQPVIQHQEDATEADKFIYEQVKDRYEFEHNRTGNLDNKSSNLIGWIGLIISVLSIGRKGV
jgi:hypothetical protein